MNRQALNYLIIAALMFSVAAFTSCKGKRSENVKLNVETENLTPKIVVEKINLPTNRYDNVIEIPKIIDLNNADNLAVESINYEIYIYFFDVDANISVWDYINFDYLIQDDILYINFNGEYTGAYPVQVEDFFFFNIKTGEKLQMSRIPFQSLFTLSGYFDFINKFWLNGVKEAFKEAKKCAGGDEPYCSFYDINYSIDNNKLLVSMTDDCYPRVVRACSPYYNISVDIDDIEEYLNDIGKYLLVENNSTYPIDRLIANNSVTGHIPENMFIFGRIDDKYPFSMAINIDYQNQITGYYYYDNRRQKINLHGVQDGDYILLTEEVNGQITGYFELTLSANWRSNTTYTNLGYLSGIWLNGNKTNMFDITFNTIKTTRVISY